MQEKQYYLGFSLFPGVGSKIFGKLLLAFKTAQSAWNAREDQLVSVLGKALTEKFIGFRKTIDLQEEQEKLFEKKIEFLIPREETYPKLLNQLPQHPFVLYVKGNSALVNETQTIGIVGTRKISGYGREVTELFTRDFVQHNFVTVSGLAFGVDAVVATTTMDAHGKTIAVLGCGVDCCTPRENQRIYDRILKSGGAIVSTFKPDETASRGTFPARNAIIAGLSLGVLVTEGTADSGALITAEYAKKFNRPVFAVPGPITSSLSKGPNSLIQQGAIPVTDSSEILDRLGIITKIKDQKSNLRNVKAETKEENQILQLLATNPLHFDEIVRTIGKSTQEIGTLLSMMELKGLVRNNGGMYSL